MTLQREEWLRVQELAASLRGHNTFPYKRLRKIKVVGRALNLSTNLEKPPRVAQTVHPEPARPLAPVRTPQICRYIEGCFWDRKRQPFPEHLPEMLAPSLFIIISFSASNICS